MADLIIDGKLEEISEWYAEKGSKSRLIEDAYEATDFFPELGEGGKWLRFTAAAIRNSSGHLIGAVETLEDITDRMTAEESLREHERRLESIIQGSPIPTFVIGKDHSVLYWNKALEELTRIRAEEMIGTRNHWRAFYSEPRPCMADLLVDATLKEISQWYRGKYSKSKLIKRSYEVIDFFPELGDSGRWLRFTAAAIRDSKGDMVGAVETLEDITERKRSEIALQKAHDELEQRVEERTMDLLQFSAASALPGKAQKDETCGSPACPHPCHRNQLRQHHLSVPEESALEVPESDPQGNAGSDPRQGRPHHEGYCRTARDVRGCRRISSQQHQPKAGDLQQKSKSHQPSRLFSVVLENT